MFDFLKTKEQKAFNPWNYQNGSQSQRLLEILNDFEIVPLPYFLRMEPRIACYSAGLAVLRKRWYVIANETIDIKSDRGYETHSFYQLLKKPGEAFEKDNKIKEYIAKNYK